MNASMIKNQWHQLQLKLTNFFKKLGSKIEVIPLFSSFEYRDLYEYYFEHESEDIGSKPKKLDMKK